MKKQLVAVLSITIALSCLLLPVAPAMAATYPQTTLVASDAVGAQGDLGSSTDMDIDRTGRNIVFSSRSANLVVNDTNGKNDIFLKDRTTGSIQRISDSPDGSEANGDSNYGHISADGRFAVFSSTATNLTTNDSNGQEDVFLRDIAAGTTKLVSRPLNGGGANGASFSSDISEDGRYVVFDSAASNLVSGDTNGFSDIYVYDNANGMIQRVGSLQGDNNSYNPSISCNGGYVAFTSLADNLVTGDLNGHTDVFVANVATGIVKDISLGANNDSGAPSISCDGSAVIYNTTSSNLVSSDTNNANDIVKYDVTSGSTGLISIASSGAQGSNTAQGDVGANSSISDDNRYVVFSAAYTNLVPNDVNGHSDIFIRDTLLNTTDIVSVSGSGILGNGTSIEQSISGNGLYVVYGSESTNLALGATSGRYTALLAALPHDSLPPLVTGTPDRQPNAAGWYNGDVNISWTPADPAPSSGAPSVPAATVASLEGTHTYTSGQSCDPAGNCATGSIDLKIDTQKPTISYSLGTPPNGAGWNKDDVLVTFTCDDPTSGIDSCTAPVTVGEGKNQKITGTAVDKAGNTQSVDVFVSVDKQKPTISYALTPAANAAGWNKSNFTVTFMCLDQASLSGLASCTTPVTVSAETAGQDIVGTAVDVADNSQTVTAHIKLDKTLPTASNITMSGLVLGLLIGGTTNVSANVADANAATGVVSGVVAAEYFFDTDPGEGLGMAMTVHPNSTATSVANAPGIGQHTLYVRSKDAAGNWSVKAGKAFTRLL